MLGKMKRRIAITVIIFCCAMQLGYGRTVNSTISLNVIRAKSECDGEVGNTLNQIRALMHRNSIQAYIVPMSDAHQNEYIADHDKRLQYISKFTGSAGEAIITLNEAALWTDSRYHLQAEQQLNHKCWQLMKKGLPNVPSESEWLITNLPPNATVGVDPFLIMATNFHEMEKKLKANGHDLISFSDNLVDAVWSAQPTPSQAPIIPLEVKFSGKESGLKIYETIEKTKQKGGESLIITALDDIAWLLNLRGSDITYNPLFFSYVILSPEKSYFFVDNIKIGNDVQSQMLAEKVNLTTRDYTEILDAVKDIVNTTVGKIVMSTSVSQAIYQIVPQDRLIQNDLVAILKSVKNPIEAENMENAHVRDGLALIQYMHWLNETIDKENVTELSGAEKLSEFRAEIIVQYGHYRLRLNWEAYFIKMVNFVLQPPKGLEIGDKKQDNFRGLSFEVISAVGEHAAMAHYSPNMEMDKQITRKEMYLVDSGGHYWDGTTDVTRTVHFGIPTAEQQQCYTRVLKGFIAFATSVFPKDTPLSYLDHIARRSLWQAGLNYGHGTGHGVGMYLAVHEYPPLINAKGTGTLFENVFTSNEPGYYKDNEFGIRIEDVMQVINSDLSNAFNGQGALTFKSITYAPLQTRLIDTDLLTKEEANYVNAYNQRVMSVIGPILLKHKLMDTYQWLERETRQICSWAK